jgi:hypothetical protein
MDTGRTTKVYIDKNGNRLVVSNGGEILREAGSIHTVAGMPASVTTTMTPATGTCACQFVFKDALGVQLIVPVAGILYLSGSDGLSITSSTSIAVLTNGALLQLVTGKAALFVTTATGLLGITLTMTSGTYYISFVLPNGTIITSSALVVN